MTERMHYPLAKSHSERFISAMFDRIAPRYDFLNRLLSFGQDVVWRKKVGQHLPQRGHLHVLDLATGTGDLALTLVSRYKNIVGVIGLDVSPNMIELGQNKVEKAGYSNCVQLQVGDASDIPFADASFDVVTIAFGIRNVVMLERALGEIQRILKPKGRLIVLEFSLPRSMVIRWVYLLYFRYILPLIGGAISGDKSAYQYLNQSAEAFPHGPAFLSLLQKNGFGYTEAYPLTFGVASIYVGEKEAP